MRHLGRRFLGLIGALLLALAGTPARAHEGHPQSDGFVPGSPYWAGPALSGSWYDPARSGAIAFWFTYPAVGEPGEQAWLIAQDGVVQGDTISFSVVYQPVGARFGDAFNPGDVNRKVWGTMQMKFVGCNTASVTYQGLPAYGTGTRTLTRLTVLDELDCAGNRALLENGARALDGIAAKSGTWYVPSRSGEGWVLEELPNGQLLVYWFTFDPDGNQAWTIGLGARSGNQVTITDNVITKGTRFGDAFDASKVERLPWGQVTFDFQTCNLTALGYASTRPGYGSANREPVRLTQLLGAPCLDQAPTPEVVGHWEERAAMPPNPQSEHAVAEHDGKLYAIGGFGDLNGFKRYDTATGAWTRLPDTPAGRHHLAAFAFPFERAIYMSGGDTGGTGDQTYSGHKFNLDTSQWSPVPPLLFNFGSHAAVVGGRAYIGDQGGALQEYDPRQNAMRVILPRGTTPRDHSQVIAFFDEIWMIGGRLPDQAAVDIYDPVSETWREGPRTRRFHNGFAADVVGARVVVAGGEHIGTPPPRLEAGFEAYSAGSEGFRLLQDMPQPVHGVAGAGVGNVFYSVSGSLNPSLSSGATGRTWAYVFDN
jgi:hypothetical protein